MNYINCAISISIIQLFLSRKVLLNLIYVYRYYNEVNTIYNEIIQLFNDKDKLDSKNADKYKDNIIKLLLFYETSGSSNKVQLNSKIFYENNDMLLDRWNKLKKDYKIVL